MFFAAACVVSAFYGLERCGNVEFVCTNGDYQSYNILRRFLDGQIPYYDFANYLGMGLLVLCAPLLALHNTFSGSLFVTFFVAAFVFMLFVGLIFYFVTKSPLVSACAALLMPKLVSSAFFNRVPGYDYGGYYITYYLNLLSKPVLSFRIVRMALPMLLCLLLLLLVRRARHRGAVEQSLLREWAKRPKCAFFWGLAVGAGLVWSNDFGFACIGASILILLILAVVDGVQTHRWRSAFVRFLGFVPGLAAGAALSICLVTRGHPGSYLSFTQGVGSWQFWYFGNNGQEKNYGLLDLFSSEMLYIHGFIYVCTL